MSPDGRADSGGNPARQPALYRQGLRELPRRSKAIAPQKDFGPDLSALGGKDLSQLYFGDSKIPRNLIAYIQAKITNPVSVNPAARMPLYSPRARTISTR